MKRIVIIPGNGGSHVATDNWYPWIQAELQKKGYIVVATDMPDPVAAHMDIWLPYMESTLKMGEETIAIGHSSGAVAILRYLETHRLAGAVLIGVMHTDLGFDDEKEAGWYKDPWQWAKIKENAGWIEQFYSTDDPFIPVAEPEFIHTRTNSVAHIFHDRGHFMIDDKHPNETVFPELIEVIRSHDKGNL